MWGEPVSFYPLDLVLDDFSSLWHTQMPAARKYLIFCTRSREAVIPLLILSKVFSPFSSFLCPDGSIERIQPILFLLLSPPLWFLGITLSLVSPSSCFLLPYTSPPVILSHSLTPPPLFNFSSTSDIIPLPLPPSLFPFFLSHHHLHGYLVPPVVVSITLTCMRCWPTCRHL